MRLLTERVDCRVQAIADLECSCPPPHEGWALHDWIVQSGAWLAEIAKAPQTPDQAWACMGRLADALRRKTRSPLDICMRQLGQAMAAHLERRA